MMSLLWPLTAPITIDTDALAAQLLDEGAASFVRMLLNSPLLESEYNRIKVGGGTHTNKLNLGDLHTLIFPLPPLAEQNRIVAKADELMRLCDELEAQLTTAQSGTSRLLDSVLHQSLRGSSSDILTDGEMLTS